MICTLDTMEMNLSRLESSFDHSRPVICLYGICYPIQCMDIVLMLRRMLEKEGYQHLLLVSPDVMHSPYAEAVTQGPGLAFVCHDINILERMPWVKLLITNEFSLNRQRRPRCKTLLFQHNIDHSHVHGGNFWADYVLTHIKGVHAAFDYSLYPDSIKITVNDHITVVPAGYPKLDILCQRRGADSPRRRFCYFPTKEEVLQSDGVDIDRLRKEEVVLFDSLLDAYPDYKICIRPYPEGRHTLRIQQLRERYALHARVHFDDGDDNAHWLVEADVLLTDASDVDKNFALATLRPTVRLMPPVGAPASTEDMRHTPFGYACITAQQALNAVAHALDTIPQWRARLAEWREASLLQPGTACAFLCAHMKDILDDTAPPHWQRLPKGHTPYDKPRHYLLAFASPHYVKRYFPAPLEDAFRLHGPHPRIALAAVRAFIRHWQQSLLVQFDMACACLPPAHLLGLLRHMVRTGDGGITARVRLLWALHRWEPHAPELSSLLAELHHTVFDDIHSAILVARVARCHGASPDTAWGMVAASLPPGHNLPNLCTWGGPWQEDATLLTVLLLERGQADAALTLLYHWEHALVGRELLISHALCHVLVDRLVQEHSLPDFFRPGSLPLPGADMHCQNMTQIVEILEALSRRGIKRDILRSLYRQAGVAADLWPVELYLLERVEDMGHEMRTLSEQLACCRAELHVGARMPAHARSQLTQRANTEGWWPKSFHLAAHTVPPTRLAVWGTGGRYRDLAAPALRRLGHAFVVTLFIDSAPDKAGTTLDGVPVVTPEDAAHQCFDAVLIASYAVRPIVQRALEVGIGTPMYTFP